MVSILFCFLTAIVAQQVNLDYFNDPFDVTQTVDNSLQMRPHGPLLIQSSQNPVLGVTTDGTPFNRSLAIDILENAALDVLGCSINGFTNVFTVSGSSGSGAVSAIATYEMQDPMNLEGFDHMKLLLLKADKDYTLSIEMCDTNNGCSKVSKFYDEGNSEAAAAVFFRPDFSVGANFADITYIQVIITAPADGDIIVGILSTIYFACSEADLNTLTQGSYDIQNECYYGHDIYQNAYEECQVCCNEKFMQTEDSCSTVTCNDNGFGQPGVWTGLGTCIPVVQSDPHLSGFNGERMDIAHDSFFKSGQLLNLFCAGETSFFAELGATEVGDIYVTAIFAKFGDLAFSMNIFGEVRVSVDKTYTDEEGRQHFVSGSNQVTVAADGMSLSADDTLLKIGAAVHFSDGVDFLDLDLASLAGRFPAAGMLGRTLNGRVSEEAFNNYAPFVVSVEELSTFQCEV